MHLLVSKTNQRERRFCEGIVEENGRNLIKLAPGFIHFTNKHTQTHHIPGLPLYLVGWGPGEAGGRERVGASTGSRCQHQHYQPGHRRRTWKRAPPPRIGRRVPRSVRRKVNSRSYRMDIPFTLKNLCAQFWQVHKNSADANHAASVTDQKLRKEMREGKSRFY